VFLSPPPSQTTLLLRSPALLFDKIKEWLFGCRRILPSQVISGHLLAYRHRYRRYRLGQHLHWSSELLRVRPTKQTPPWAGNHTSTTNSCPPGPYPTQSSADTMVTFGPSPETSRWRQRNWRPWSESSTTSVSLRRPESPLPAPSTCTCRPERDRSKLFVERRTETAFTAFKPHRPILFVRTVSRWCQSRQPWWRRNWETTSSVWGTRRQLFARSTWGCVIFKKRKASKIKLEWYEKNWNKKNYMIFAKQFGRNFKKTQGRSQTMVTIVISSLILLLPQSQHTSIVFIQQSFLRTSCSNTKYSLGNEEVTHSSSNNCQPACMHLRTVKSIQRSLLLHTAKLLTPFHGISFSILHPISWTINSTY